MTKTPTNDGALDPATLDLGYLALFVGMRMNELVTQALAAAGFAELRQSHGYLFQHLMAGPRTVTELSELMGVTQQAASKAVAELVELGFLEQAPTSDRRARRIALSSRARKAIATTREIRAEREQSLRAVHGAKAIDEGRALLARILEGLGGLEAVRGRRVRSPS